jgi:hypothetical protein
VADERSDRMAAARALGKLITSEKGRKLLQDNHYTSDSQIVVALESDRLADVLARARRYAPPVVAAVYYAAEGNFKFVDFQPDTGEPSGDSHPLGANISIGMLLDYTAAHQGRFTFDNWSSYRARQFVSV